MEWLLDGNVLVALRLDSHPHHHRAHRWFANLGNDKFATCCITQGTLLRMHMRFAFDSSPSAAWAALEEISAHPQHIYWDSSLNYRDVPHRYLLGPRQVADAWLAELARRKLGRLLTLDESLAQLHDDIAILIPFL